MALFKAKEKDLSAPDMSRLPRHVAIIMDGNGRWAKKRGLPRTAGHAAGAETFRSIATYCKEIGLDYLTVYAFSTENWKRSKGEVAGLMKLLSHFIKAKEKELGNAVAIPINMLRSGERVFLDDKSVDDVQNALQVPVIIVKSSGLALFEAMLGYELEEE